MRLSSGTRSFISADLIPFLILLLPLGLHGSSADDAAGSFKLIGPDYPVVSVLGEDAMLPCRLSPPISAENMEVRWFRTRFGSLVPLYEDGKDQNEQLPEYRGRTELIRDHISSGNVSLRIHSVRLYDEGRYTCHVRSDIYYQDNELELKVAGMGSAPHMSVVHYQDRGVRVVCESAGWYPEPEVIWRQEDGQSLTPLSERQTPKQNGLFNIRSSLSVTINKRSNFSCCIRNIILNQERESTVSISGSSEVGGRHCYELIAVAAVVVLSLALAAAAALFYCIRRKTKRNRRPLQHEETPQPLHENGAGSGGVSIPESQAGGEETSLVTAAAVESNGACGQEAPCELILCRDHEEKLCCRPPSPLDSL